MKIISLFLIIISTSLFSVANEGILVENISYKTLGMNSSSIVVYADITNSSDTIEYLLEVEAQGFSNGKIYKTVLDQNIARFVKIDRLSLPAHKEISLTPNGIYIVLHDLPKNLAIFKNIKLIFKFSNTTIIKDLPPF